jgi:hypothetical protein
MPCSNAEASAGYSPLGVTKEPNDVAQPHAASQKAAVIPMARMTCALWLIMISSSSLTLLNN